MGRYVVCAIGSKLIVFDYSQAQLVGRAFYDAQVFVSSLESLKGLYLVIGDIVQSVHFVKWHEGDQTLTRLGKDDQALAVTNAGFSIASTSLGILATDANKNLNVFHFAPTDVRSRNGQRLVVRSNFHLGVHVNVLKRLRTFVQELFVQTSVYVVVF